MVNQSKQTIPTEWASRGKAADIRRGKMYVGNEVTKRFASNLCFEKISSQSRGVHEAGQRKRTYSDSPIWFFVTCDYSHSNHFELDFDWIAKEME